MDSSYGFITGGENKPRDSLPSFHYDGRMRGRGKIPVEEAAVVREKIFLWPSGHQTGGCNSHMLTWFYFNRTHIY